MKKSNYIAELTFLGFLLLIGITFMITLIEPENDPLQVVGSVEYARVLIALFLVAIVAVMIQTIIHFSAYVKAGAEVPLDENTRKINHLSNKLVAATSVVFLFYCYFMQKLGYYTTGLIVLEVYQLILYKAQNGRLDKSGVVKITLISVCVTAFLYLLFSVAFQLYLPRGILR